ncbi:uncharacterized protein LOC132701877 [Cylas formicarius]|uniref:uncharacterized protein LOC132701877 n=1 Tax=Cylas formicarius TaxID=197179 RepID=UPI002958C699|nr:uncharacterized protein LOC132701877 [Cylas formicarius]
MAGIERLLRVTDAERAAILKGFDVTDQEFQEKVTSLREWLRRSDHLPRENAERNLRVALLNSKLSLERAKQWIENYYRIKTLYADELYDNMVPASEKYREAKSYVVTVPLPKLTPDLCRITVFKLTDPEGRASDAQCYHLVGAMISEIRITTDFFASNILVIDLEQYCWKILLKFTPTINQKVTDIFKSVRYRIQEIHFVNLPPVTEKLMVFFKSIFPSKIAGWMYLHKDVDSLWERIPRENLPSDYGGAERSLSELYGDWCSQIEGPYAEFFEKLREAKSTKKYETGDSHQVAPGVALEGSFRKLEID